jgi:MOSC domain-containing protein YiiM
VTIIDSSSVGDPARYRTYTQLEQMLAGAPEAPTDRGRVVLVVKRGERGRRETLERAALAPGSGIPGDAWGRHAKRNDDMQVAVMQRDVAELIANGQPLTLFGDNLFVDLDLSTGNLPPGSRVSIDGTLLEVTAMPHNGCRKFRARFGDDALRFVSSAVLRHRNLRGIYMKVIVAGEIATGAPVAVISRAPARAPPT